MMVVYSTRCVLAVVSYVVRYFLEDGHRFCVGVDGPVKPKAIRQNVDRLV